MKKILMMGMSPVLAGTETFIMTYYRNLSPSKFKIDFLVNSNEKIIYEDEIMQNGSKIYRLPRKGKNLKKYYQSLDDLFKSFSGEYDIFWFNGMGIVNLDYFTYAKKYGIERRIMHSHSSKWGGNFIRRIFHEINRRKLDDVATDYFACSETAADFMFPTKIRSKVKIINNAIEMENFTFDSLKRQEIRDGLGWPENVKIVGNVGRLSYQKNQSALIDYFYEAYKQEQNLRLVILGSKTSNDKTKEIVENKIKNYGLEKVVKLVGTQNDMKSWLSALDLFIMTSKFEGLPLSAVEAQANGLPVLLSDSITKETQINDNIIFLPLGDSVTTWADKIISQSYQDRLPKEQVQLNFDLKGFNIKTQVANIEKILNDK